MTKEECWKWAIDGYGDLTVNDLHLSRDAALTELLSSLPAQDWPATAQAKAYAPMPVKRNEVEVLNPLAFILEMLDAKYADPEEPNGPAPTPRMEQAENEFIGVVISEYIPWCHKQIHTEVVSVEKWLLEHPGVKPAEDNEDSPAALPIPSAGPATLKELHERLLGTIADTLETLPGFETLTARYKTACIKKVAVDVDQRVNEVISESGGPDAPAPEDLLPYSELVVNLGKAYIQHYIHQATGS